MISVANNLPATVETDIPYGCLGLMDTSEKVRVKIFIHTAFGNIFISLPFDRGSVANFEGAESGLNTLGCYLSTHSRLNDALALFKLNTEMFPKSANTFDSYAETLLKAGQKKAVLEKYGKVLSIDPGNANAKRKSKLFRDIRC